MNKRKIINDPVYGLIHIPYGLIYDVLQHPYFQRLRMIKQLGLSHLVYPGATHTRFEHVLGAMHLMTLAIEVLRNKGVSISDDEALAVSLAILLHDIGHGPFSHTMEHLFVPDLSHEDITLLFMESLNREYNGALDLCIQIFKNDYHKSFLHNLVSSQLDMDRLDYLTRDSFYSGVSEGVIGADRIIKMLALHNNELAVEAKGIYSIENFLIARRLMYWQVYLHKTVLVSENLLQATFLRAKELAAKGQEVFASPALRYFIYNDLSARQLGETAAVLGRSRSELLENFALLDDSDLLSAIKAWTQHADYTLSFLASSLINRKFFKVEIRTQPFSEDEVNIMKEQVCREHSISLNDAAYFIFTGSVSNHAYSIKDDKIKILHKNGQTQDISDASDMLNISVLSKNVQKHYLCYPKCLEKYREAEI